MSTPGPLIRGQHDSTKKHGRWRPRKLPSPSPAPSQQGTGQVFNTGRNISVTQAQSWEVGKVTLFSLENTSSSLIVRKDNILTTCYCFKDGEFSFCEGSLTYLIPSQDTENQVLKARERKKKGPCFSSLLLNVNVLPDF